MADSPTSAAIEAVTGMELPQSRPTADPQKRRYVVSLPPICVLVVTSAAVLVNGMTAPMVADQAPSSRASAALGPRGSGAPLEQRFPQKPLRQTAKRPYGEEPAGGDTPESLNWVIMAFSAACILAMYTLTKAICLPLQRLGTILTKLQKDPSCTVDALASINGEAPSRIAEVYVLQKAVSHLMHRMDTLGHFLPPSVVRKIAVVDSSQPYIIHRHVSIMFSDLQDFTKICEALPFSDMLMVMTRYVSVMTHASEMYEGTVAELQGDGLLVFWNTPTSVEDYVAKACKAALASQYALALLNSQFAALGLPPLGMRIGLHSGPVLSGFLGGKSRIKFGCMGDAVGLAGQLEGLCKHYGVGAICSEAIYKSLPPDSDFLMRKLDKVQLQGRSEATVLYELMHVDKHVETQAQLGRARQRAELYERALDAYQAGHFVQASELAAQVLQADPKDVAAQVLRARIAYCLDERGHVCLGQAEQEDWTGVLALDER